MTRTRQVPALLVYVFVSLCVDATAQENSTSLAPDSTRRDLLIATIPDLSVADESLSSFEIQGRLPSPFLPTEPIHAQVAWDRVSGSSMILSSSRTGTPLIWAAGGEAYIFDCSSSALTVIRGVHPHVTFQILNGQIDYLYRLCAKEMGHTIDLSSFAHAYSPNQVHGTNRLGLTLSGLSPSGRSRIHLSYGTSLKLSFNGFQVTAADPAHTLLNAIDRIQINEPLSPHLTQAPSVSLQDKEVEIVEATDLSVVGLYRIAQEMRRSLVLHIAVEEPGYQGTVSRDAAFMDVDWDSCARNYTEIAPALKSIFNETDATKPRLATRPN